MTKRDIAELACRILALYLLVVNLHSFLWLPLTLGMSLWETIRYGDWDGVGVSMLFISLATGLVLALVWFLWTRAWWIAEKLVPKDAGYSRWPHLRIADLQDVAFSMVGVFTVVSGVQYFARSVGMYVGILYAEHYARRITFFEWLTMEDTVGSLAECVLGLWLVLGSRGLVRLIRRLRRPEFEETAEALVPTPVSPADTMSE